MCSLFDHCSLFGFSKIRANIIWSDLIQSWSCFVAVSSGKRNSKEFSSNSSFTTIRKPIGYVLFKCVWKCTHFRRKSLRWHSANTPWDFVRPLVNPIFKLSGSASFVRMVEDIQDMYQGASRKRSRDVYYLWKNFGRLDIIQIYLYCGSTITLNNHDCIIFINRYLALLLTNIDKSNRASQPSHLCQFLIFFQA